MAKKINIEGFGDLFVQLINFKDREGTDCTADGKPVKREMVGERAKTVYKLEDGTEIPSTQVCKKYDMDGREMIVPKLNATKTVTKARIREVDENGIIYRALERKFYNVTTDCDTLKQKVIQENKTLEFPLSVGNGYKAWKGVLTNWHGKLMLVCCRGDLNKALEKYNEETIEIEIEEPKQQEEFLMAVM
jgi:S-adenosylmethionine hydrolase